MSSFSLYPPKMEEAQFFLLLPSNASLNLYSDNTLTSYKVQLPEPIILEGEYEVGLQSIIWPRTFNNITESSKRLYYQTPSGLADVVLLSKGYYESMTSLIDHINKQLKEDVADNIHMKFEPQSEKVFVTVKNGYQLLLSNDLSQILGFGNEMKTISQSQYSPFVSDLSGGMQCLYVYSDIVSFQIVGDTKARLLKVLPVEGKHGDTIYRSFDVPTYYPVGTKEFQDIKIDIRDGSGRKIQFQRGRVVVNLHFRKRQLSYLV